MSAKLTPAEHRARNTRDRSAPAAVPPPRPAASADVPPDNPPAPLDGLGPAGARLYAWCWRVWIDVLDERDVLVLTNLAKLADAAADMDALYAEADPGKRAMAGRLRVSARLRYSQELARITKLAEEAMSR